MSENIDLKQLWNKQEVVVTDVQDLIKKANKFKRNQLLKLVVVNILFLATSAAIGFIWYYYQPEYLTTKIGIVIIILAMVVFVAAYNSVARFLFSNKLDLDSKAYLRQLLQIKEKQLFQQTTMMNIYFFMLSLGIGLYIFEYASKMELIWAFLSYGITTLWIAFNWFYLRPKVIQKQEDKLNKMIKEFSRVKDQLS